MQNNITFESSNCRNQNIIIFHERVSECFNAVLLKFHEYFHSPQYRHKISYPCLSYTIHIYIFVYRERDIMLRLIVQIQTSNFIIIFRQWHKPLCFFSISKVFKYLKFSHWWQWRRYISELRDKILWMLKNTQTRRTNYPADPSNAENMAFSKIYPPRV